MEVVLSNSAVLQMSELENTKNKSLKPDRKGEM